MNKRKLYAVIIVTVLTILLSNAYAVEISNVVKKDSVQLIEKTIMQNFITQNQNGIFPQNLVYDEKNKLFYVINPINISLDIIDYSNIETLKFVNKIDLSPYGKTPIAVAFNNNVIAVCIENENEADSGKLVFLNEKGDFINAFSIAPDVKSLAFNSNGKHVYVSNSNASGYKMNVIDISKGIENVTNAEITTLAYEKEKGGEDFVKFDPSGFGMMMIAMSVVFIALIFLYLVFKLTGHLYTSAARKKTLQKQGKTEEAAMINEDESGEVFAAIAMALHLYQSQFHDEEQTVITMEKVARTYSPWSSKIYGLRHTPNNN